MLSSCTHNPIPEGYKGPTARIVDTIEPQGEHSAYIFFVSELDGQEIDNASAWATRVNSGNGITIRLYSLEFGRNVPAAPATFTIVGYVHYPAPIQTLFNPTHRVSGKISFTPLPDRDYVVKGEINDQHPRFGSRTPAAIICSGRESRNESFDDVVGEGSGQLMMR